MLQLIIFNLKLLNICSKRKQYFSKSVVFKTFLLECEGALSKTSTGFSGKFFVLKASRCIRTHITGNHPLLDPIPNECQRPNLQQSADSLELNI